MGFIDLIMFARHFRVTWSTRTLRTLVAAPSEEVASVEAKKAPLDEIKSVMGNVAFVFRGHLTYCQASSQQKWRRDRESNSGMSFTP